MTRHNAATHLRRVPTNDAGLTIPATRPEAPALARLCAGEPITLASSEANLIALINTADAVRPYLLDDEADPNQYRLAELLLEYAVNRYGTNRKANGARVENVQSMLLRYLIPFAVELELARRSGRTGIAATTHRELERLPQILAGDQPLPAAVVASDQLGRHRRATTCIWLTLDDAARVSAGGLSALRDAIETGDLTPMLDTRTGEPLVSALSLRTTGLLLEKDGHGHGLNADTAHNVVSLLNLTINRAKALGATVRSDEPLSSIEPLKDRRLRPATPATPYVGLTTVVAAMPSLGVVSQSALVMGRLIGGRISELYGLMVCDYWRDEQGIGWLRICKQGGKRIMHRDPDTGRILPQAGKDGTKTEAGDRYIPLPDQLADLLELLVRTFHTDPDTGMIELGNRLIPGIGLDDESGQATFRADLKAVLGCVPGSAFHPHDLRAAVVTDLKNAGVSERVAHYYTGHELANPSVQDRNYDLGPADELKLEAARALTRLLADAGVEQLWAPTQEREQWGTKTRNHARAQHLHGRLLEVGWRVNDGATTAGRELTATEVAARLGIKAAAARKLMAAGTIPAHTTLWGTRPVRVAYESDVERYRSGLGTTIQELADDIGWSYHQVRFALVQLGLYPGDRSKGAAIRLDDKTVRRLKAEIDRRAMIDATVMTHEEAAETLDVAVTSIGTLVRNDLLEEADGPTNARLRHVTRASVERYQRDHPPADRATSAGDGSEEVAVTCTQARTLLGVTRNRLSELDQCRLITQVRYHRNRHVYYSATSLLVYAEGSGMHVAAHRIRRHLASRET